jgi:uncharacterized protein YfaS (alpha-2-macroglobulin family)
MSYVDPKRGGARNDTRVVSVTDLAITGKMSRFGSLAWVTQLSDGKPVGGATVSVMTRGKGEVFSVETDANGLASIPADKYSPVKDDEGADRSSIVVAKTSDDYAFRRVADLANGWREGVSLDMFGRLSPMGMIFADRGVYRPGEMVRVKAIFRKPTQTGTATPSGQKVKLFASDGWGNGFFERALTLDEFGEVAVDVPVPATAHLGMAELRAEIEDGTAFERAATESVELAAYKPSELKVEVDPSSMSYVRGDSASFSVRGDYLFGAPMSGADTRFTVRRAPAFFAPPGTEGFVVDDGIYGEGVPEASERASEFQSGSGELDAHGAFAGSVALSMPNQHGPEHVTIEAEVTDLSRQSTANRATVMVHPAEFYVALKQPENLFVESGAKIDANVRAVEPSGAGRAGVDVHVELVRRAWRSVLEASGEMGSHYEWKPVDTVAATCDTKTAGGDASSSCALVVPRGGYFILRASAKDARGNAAAASTSLYALADGGDAEWLVQDSNNVELVADKKSYEVGDTAKILVKSPFKEAEALVTVERAGIYQQTKMTLSGATPTLSIPIDDTMRPNAFVSVHLVRGRTAKPVEHGQDVGAPAYRLGYAQLVVNPEERRLHVAVAPAKPDYKPGDEVDADVAVTDRAGKGTHAEVTFYAVDEGVLMLTGYKTPDPIPLFTAPRALAVFALESREDLARVFVSRIASNGEDKGNEGGGGSGARSEFRATAYFEPKVVTSQDGKAHVHFKLPDNLTTYRLMAVVAAEDDRFGFGDAQITTSRPLMARPELPRFLRAGDSMEAGVIVSSKGMNATDVEVTIAAQGVKLLGNATQRVSLPKNGSVEVRWPIATPNVGTAKLAFKAEALSDGGEKDSVEVTRPIEAPLSMEAVALAGDTVDAIAEKLGDLRSIRPDIGDLDVLVASTALVGIGDGAEQLVEYPYGCTEQLTSRLVPLVPLRSLSNDFHVKLPANTDRYIDEALAKILANQKSDGSFGYWPDSPSGDLWVTAYALFGLDLAKKAGRPVPDETIERAVRYVREELKNPQHNERWYLAADAFVVDVLASIGRPDPGYASMLYERRGELPLFARALLAHAIGKGEGADTKRASELLRDLEQHVRITPAGAIVAENLGDSYAVLLDSDARTTALVMRALVAIDPKGEMLSRLARGLLGMREGGKWRSTQDAAWSLLALDDYRHAQEGAAPDFDGIVYVNQEPLFSAPFHGRSALQTEKDLPVSELLKRGAGGETLGFEARGKGRLFYETRLRYAKKELPHEPLDRGFYVKKVMRTVTPGALHDALATLPDASATDAAGGSLVLVDLIVITPDPREQVVIDDPLPAGLEAVDATFATTTRSENMEVAPGGEGDQSDADDATDDARANGRAYNRSYYHREVQDDRVLTFVEHMAAGMYHYRYLARATTFGRFVVPPTRAECMYDPATFGRTAATTFEVKQ